MAKSYSEKEINRRIGQKLHGLRSSKREYIKQAFGGYVYRGPGRRVDDVEVNKVIKELKQNKRDSLTDRDVSKIKKAFGK